MKEVKGLVSSGKLLELVVSESTLKLWICAEIGVDMQSRSSWCMILLAYICWWFAINHIVDSALLLAVMSQSCIHTSPSTFQRNQRLYAAPAILQELRDSIMEDIKKKDEAIVLAGDCWMDSPGFSATKGTYSFMDTNSEKVVSMEHGDKRQVRSSLIEYPSAVCIITLVIYRIAGKFRGVLIFVIFVVELVVTKFSTHEN